MAISMNRAREARSMGIEYTGYNKVLFDKYKAAESRGFDFSFEDEVYICRQCGEEFMSIQAIKEDHDCQPETRTLGDFLCPLMQTTFPPEPVVLSTSEDCNNSVLVATSNTSEKPKTWKMLFGSLETELIMDETAMKTRVEEAVKPQSEPNYTGFEGKISFGSIDYFEPTVDETVSEEDQIVGNCTGGTRKSVLDRFLEEKADYFKKRAAKVIHKRKDGTLVYKEMHHIAHEPKPREVTDEWGPTRILTSMSIAGGIAPSMDIEPQTRKPLHRTPSQKTKTYYKKINKTSTQIRMLESQIKSIIIRNGLSFEYLEHKVKKSLRGRVIKYSGSKMVQLHTEHHKGFIRQFDIKLNTERREWITDLARRRSWRRKWHASDIKPGASGLVLNSCNLNEGFSKPSFGILVVRGKLYGRIADSQRKLARWDKFLVQHYSDTAVKFWDSYSRTFQYNKPKQSKHSCTSDLGVQDCGSIAAMVTQTLFQFGRITCQQCVAEYCDLSTDAVKERVDREIDDTIKNVSEKYPQFTHITKFLKEYRTMLHSTNPNTEAHKELLTRLDGHDETPYTHMKVISEVLQQGSQAEQAELARASDLILAIAKFVQDELEQRKTVLDFENYSAIQKLIGDKKAAPYSHLNKLNELLAKQRGIPKLELDAIGKELLEVVRFQKNRTDNIQKGDLSYFRNKVSSKTHMNYDLLCDNQRDKNGNFQWGMRSYHAKRFLENYFERIDPTNGYEKHIIRRNENGVRKLAIGKLIVSTNFEKYRQQMVGELVPKHPLTDACVSKAEGNFKYPCCCVTLEDGTPLESEFKLPTKHHLVLGNTGDSKFVDLPSPVEETMFIAKEGFCYVNIFFSMLINVREDLAKDFTKTVRDTLIPRLGKWPTMMDLATSCSFLAVLFPDTMTAELPKIYVDHTAKTMHVIDSYGSLNTGYHILKANTVEQLVQFSSESLESELKFYKVGGSSTDDRQDCALKQVIRGIYRPKVMQYVLEKHPYHIVMAIVSPSVLIALYRSGSLDMAMQHWLSRDRGTANLFALLTTLAIRVTRAKHYLTQRDIIQSRLDQIQRSLDSFFNENTSIYAAQNAINMLKEEMMASKDIRDAGYLIATDAMDMQIEKNYQNELHRSWQELSWREKFCQMWHWKRSSELSTIHDSVKEELGLVGTWTESCKQQLARVNGVLKKNATALGNNMRDKTHRAIGRFVCWIVSSPKYVIPNLSTIFNVIIVMNLLIGAYNKLNQFVENRQAEKRRLMCYENELAWDFIEERYIIFTKDLKELPTYGDFLEHLREISEKHAQIFEGSFSKCLQEKVNFQAKSNGERTLEKTIAFTALVMMLFDSERSDCVFKLLNKLKGIMGTIEAEPAKFQSIDEIQDTITEKNMTIDFEIDSENPNLDRTNGTQFAQWWSTQINEGRTIPHYRTEGHYMEFTRQTAAQVANDIVRGTANDILIRGAVGSGKSTGLPFLISQKRSILILEPTRPLAENVFKQLKGEPFNVSPTLMMRGNVVFGSGNITIMTSGYAFHYFANNISRLKEFGVVMFDECHVIDSSAMAFRSLLKEFSFEGKIIKTSATPPGRNFSYETQFAVDLRTEEQLSFAQFAQNQGTGVNSDVTKLGNNILIYVASYNEVDTLSKLLFEKGFRVTKVDGRSMKVGGVEIQTFGTDAKKHFVVATNIIENGVTLDIDVVVDFGTKVVPELDTDARLIRYRKKSITYGERIQRLGRVGRNKEGAALKIGTTEKGLETIPAIHATEAAFLCFVHGLPVMTSGVSTSLLAKCTVPQARTMMNFELSPFYLVNFVRFDGSMHPEVHKLLVPYKLRDSTIILNKMAIPNQGVKFWPTIRDFQLQGAKIEIEPETARAPFHMKDIPNKLHEEMWGVVCKFKADAGFQRLTSMSACKIAYTLQTDWASIQRTVRLIDTMIESERVKQAYLQNMMHVSCNEKNLSLMGLLNGIKAKHMKDPTATNIAILTEAKQQLCEFANLGIDVLKPLDLQEFGVLECVQFQSKEKLSKHLELEGHWNKSLIVSDVLITCGVLAGGAFMIYSYFNDKAEEPVVFQAKGGKRQKQKLRFKAVRDRKHAYEFTGDDQEVAENFGTAYTKKGKGKGTMIGMGVKTRRFINHYGFDPSEYTFARYVDPVTGHTIDESPLTDMSLVQEHFGKVRREYMAENEIGAEELTKGIEGYFVKDLAKQVLKIDLTLHKPLLACERTSTIAGFPEREGELRQTGPVRMVKASELPTSNEFDGEVVVMESKSTYCGLRDYNPLASTICRLVHESDGHKVILHGIGYGNLIITNQHLFMRNNGTLQIESSHGVYKVQNTTTLPMVAVEKRDILLIKLPKDAPPFPRKLRFSTPIAGDKVVLVGTLFQERYNSSIVSETSTFSQHQTSHFYRHWITTKDGQCGLPLVSVRTGELLGIHSLSSQISASNFFVAFPENFAEQYLDTPENLEWTKKWSLDIDKVAWGAFDLTSNKPDRLFTLSKDIYAFNQEPVLVQGIVSEQGWLRRTLHDNLIPIARTPNQLVTKHVVKGKCVLFETYLSVNGEANTYFRPYMGAYQKSRLNREAYIKDFLKYADPITIGSVNVDIFERVQNQVVSMMRAKGFTNCEYVTDPDTIFNSLNLKAAVGALYSGKKKEYFMDYTDEMKAQIIQDSCERLYLGKMGIWNGALKAELRPLEKVEANKTRSFTAAPIDTLLGGKVCVDDFNNKFYSLNIKCPWSVGMTKFYGGWNEMLRALPEGWIYCDADGSQFDSSLSPYLINAVLNIRLEFMEKWGIGAKMLSHLYTEIIYTPIATPDGTIVKKFKGNNSGQPSTVVDNTIMVILAVYYSFCSVGLGERIEEVCKFFVNGDDLLLAVEPSCEYVLDEMQALFLQLGLKYTFDSRTRNKTELWFMSHQGHVNGDLYIPKLEIERIVSILEWDRATEPAHRLEAICASMIEAWGYNDLLNEIRKFYLWVLDQAPYNDLAKDGKAPYISEIALRRLYTGIDGSTKDLQPYIDLIEGNSELEYDEPVCFQGDNDTLDAGGKQTSEKQKQQVQPEDPPSNQPTSSDSEQTPSNARVRDQDVNAGTKGILSVPRLKKLGSELQLPKYQNKSAINLEFLLTYEPQQEDLSNKRSTDEQFAQWFEGVRDEYGVTDEQMRILVGGLMVWCIENGTSPNINGNWIMMDGNEQVSYPIKPLLDHAKPTFRQIMTRFSPLAVAYITKVNQKRAYMPRYGSQRNLTDMSLACFAFDFYEINSRTPTRAREAHMQMKAAAIRNGSNRMFGLDGNVGTQVQDTERHTTNDVNRHAHNLDGASAW